VRRLSREARILAALEHPGIVPVFDMGTGGDGTAWYAMRLVEGVRLDTAARDGRDRRDLLRILEHVCDAVAYAHAHGVLHRDLKPSNVMLGPFGEVLVLDWGVAGDRRANPDSAQVPREMPQPVGDGSVTSPGTVVGTPGFMSPEQATGAPTDERSDIYGLGAMVRELTAVHPEPVPRALQSIIARACAADPRDRYATPLELRDDLRRFAAGERVLAHRETLPEAALRFMATYRTAILLVLAYLVMRVAILLWRGI
jgi:serine/threonine protein kinase